MYAVLQLLLTLTAAAYGAKVPRIYNVLISSNKDLSPSHTVPVYEPVIRTTSIGLTYPHIIYQPFYPQLQLVSTLQTANVATGYEIRPNAPLPRPPEKTETDINAQQSDIPLPVERFVDYSTLAGLSSPEFQYGPAESQLPEEKPQQNVQDIPSSIPIYGNFKRNPEIPDVPPPPLPTKIKKP